MSDNGGGGGGRNRVLRGGKGSLLEGGIRIPLIIRGPGIHPDSKCSIPVVGFYLLPTLCKLADVTATLPEGIDGGDISHLLRGETIPVKRRFPGLAFHFPHYQSGPPQSALRLGDYKLIMHHEDGSQKLFNLANDSGESTDLAGRNPEKATELGQLLEQYLTAVRAQRPTPNPAFDPATAVAPFRKPERKGKARR